MKPYIVLLFFVALGLVVLAPLLGLPLVIILILGFCALSLIAWFIRYLLEGK